MDAHAHLISLGWAGPGHSLDSQPYKQKGHRGLAYDPAKVGNNGNGLVKPLLISQRKGRLGIGKKAHEPQAGNEWWLKGFESALGNVGKSESERDTSGASTPVMSQSQRNMSAKHGWLYSFFVKGQDMQGTIGKLDAELLSASNKKRKSDVLDNSDEEGQSDRSEKRKRKSKKNKQDAVVEFEQVSTYIALRDKDEKRRNRTERPSPVEEFRQVTEYLEIRSEKKTKKKNSSNIETLEGGSEKEDDRSHDSVEVRSDKKDKKKRKRRLEAQVSETSTPAVTEGEETSERTETKEERRERRRRRREEKERQREKEALHASVADTTQAGGQSDATEEEAAAAKAARRAERKKRKAEKEATRVAKKSR